MSNLILVGGGGHCRSCIEVIESTGQLTIKGILDMPSIVGRSISKYQITGTDEDIEGLAEIGYMMHISLGMFSANDNKRSVLYERIRKAGAETPVIISNTAIVSRQAIIGAGSIVMTRALVNINAVIGENCIINSGAIIEHDAVVGMHSHVSTAAVINGDCRIGSNCFIASGAIIRNGIAITDDVTIGMGAVVTRSIDEPGVYFGTPARKVF